jgi:hypothetical protein
MYGRVERLNLLCGLLGWAAPAEGDRRWLVKIAI